MSDTSLEPSLPPSPAAAILPPRVPVAPDTTQSPGLFRAQRTILVVEDEANMADLFNDILRIHNHHVVPASTGLEALSIFQSLGSVDLVIIDIILPQGFSGFDLADLILAKNPAQKIVFTSGCSPSLLRSRYRLTEGVNFLPKPFSPQSLLLLVTAQWRAA